jgi:uncharacterized protein YggE
MRRWLPSLAVLAATLALGVPSGSAQAAGAGPTLTVVGFGLVNLSPPNPGAIAPQLELNFQTSAATATAALQSLQADVAATEQALLGAGVPRAEMVPQGPPGLNYVTAVQETNCQKVYKLKGIPAHCTGPGFQANEQLQVTFPNLSRLAAALTKAHLATAKGVQNFWINQGGPGPSVPTPAALAEGYQQAFADAAKTASLLAAADHLTLGPAVAVTEGALLNNTPCGGMGCGPVPIQGIAPPPVGQNQELVAVTVSYATSR